MRAIALVDLDAFYTQVEVQRNPSLRDKPMAVVQYNPFGELTSHSAEENRIMNDSNGSLIAVPTAHGKADLTIYRSEGAKVLECISKFGVTERASVDEMYLDCTEEATRRLQENCGQPPMPQRLEQIHIAALEPKNDLETLRQWFTRPPDAWQDGERLLAAAAGVLADARAAVEASLGYTCSAGIAHTKILAKLGAGLHKPRAQTVVPAHSVATLLHDLPLSKLRNLGGKFGENVMETLGITTVGQLAQVSLARLSTLFGEQDGQRLYDLARGVDHYKVEPRALPRSSGCGKTFREVNTLRNYDDVFYWLKQLVKELEERIDAERAENNRRPTLLTVGVTLQCRGDKEQHVSRSSPIRKYEADALADDALALVRKAVGKASGWAITYLFIASSNFETLQSSTLHQFFNGAAIGAAAEPPAQHDAPSTTAEEAHQDVVLRNVDPAVLAELPEELREEVSRAMAGAKKTAHRNKPHKTAAKSTVYTKSIASFFKPATK